MKLENKIESMQKDIIKSTSEIVKIKSVEESPKDNMPFGEGVQRALNYAMKLSKEMGFKVVNLDNYVAYAEYGEGEEYIAVLGHLDVVPEGDGWDRDPYSGEVTDDKIFGRGTLDDKGAMIASLYGLKAIKELNIPLNKKVRIIFGTNEETGCNDIPYYLEREKPPIMGFTPDADFPVIHGEKGIAIFDITKDIEKDQTSDVKVLYIKGGNRENMVPDYAECEIESNSKNAIMNSFKEFVNSTSYKMQIEETKNGFIIKSYGVSAHGSLPHMGENAIMKLIEFLSKLDINGTIGDFIKFLNNRIGLCINGEKLGINLKDDVSGELSFNVGIIDINKNKCIVSLDVRHPVTFKQEDMVVPLKNVLKEYGIKIQNFTYNAPLYFEKNHKLVKTLQEVYREETGENLEPITIGGGTYAKEMPNTVAFGPVFPHTDDTLHKPNEYITIKDLIMCTKIYAKAIQKLCE